MSTLEDTGELRRLAYEIRRMEHDPRRPGGLDVMLLSVSIGAGIVVGVCLLILTIAPQRYSVDPGRVVLTMAAAGICIAPVLAGLYGVNCMNRKRHQRTMEKLDRLTCYQPEATEIDPAFREAVKDAYRMGRGARRNVDDA